MLELPRLGTAGGEQKAERPADPVPTPGLVQEPSSDPQRAMPPAQSQRRPPSPAGERPRQRKALTGSKSVTTHRPTASPARGFKKKNSLWIKQFTHTEGKRGSGVKDGQQHFPGEITKSTNSD